ncbi:hypothetical protein [Eisenbergiella sp.]
MRKAIVIVGAAALAAGIGFFIVLYGVGKEMNQFRICGRSR